MRTLSQAELKAVSRYVSKYPQLRDLSALIENDQRARKQLAFNIAILTPPAGMSATEIARACLIDT